MKRRKTDDKGKWRRNEIDKHEGNDKRMIKEETVDR